jgi:hypothetical protein
MGRESAKHALAKLRATDAYKNRYDVGHNRAVAEAQALYRRVFDEG